MTRSPIAALLVCVGSLSGCPGDGVRMQTGLPPLPEPPPGPPQTIYVASHGAPTNDGSQFSPLDLQTALSANSPATPGSTIWLEGGLYRGTFTSRVSGRDGAPITVRVAAGERAVLACEKMDGTVLDVLSSYVVFRDFEVTCDTPSRVDTGKPGEPNGIYADASTHVSFVNLVVHDMPGQGLALWSENVEAEVYGNLVYHNGTNHLDHGLYLQNASGTKRIEDNVVFGQASHGIHAYGSSKAALDHFYFAGNVLFDNGDLAGQAERNILVGGQRVAHDLTLVDNYTYYPPASARGSNNLGYHAGCADATVTGNYFVGPTALVLVNCTPTQFARNVFIGALEPPDLSATAPDNQYIPSGPHGTQVIVRPNRYQRGRAHVIVYNWDLQPEVTVDLSTTGLASGQPFEIRDVQDLFGEPLASGTYTGAPITLPMTGLRVATPVWAHAVPPLHTAPEFAVFIILPR